MLSALVLRWRLYNTAVGRCHIRPHSLGALLLLRAAQPIGLFLLLLALGTFFLRTEQLLGLQTADFARRPLQKRAQ